MQPGAPGHTQDGKYQMRSFDGQLSDNQPLKRTVPEKQKQLRELRETLATMKPHTSPALKESIRRRIGELQAELKGR